MAAQEGHSGSRAEIPPRGAEARSENEEPLLIERILAGEIRLFHELIRPYERSVYLLAFSVLHNEADAEEVAQETILKALAHLRDLRSGLKFKSWLLHIAVNEARFRRRKDRRHLYESIDDQGEDSEGEFMPRDFADWREIPSESLERHEVRQALQRALASLPEKYREVFLLRDIQHLSVAESSEALGIGVPAVKTQLHRARLRLREQLAPLFQRRWTDRLPFLKGRKPW